jgi:hypothetical protein
MSFTAARLIHGGLIVAWRVVLLMHGVSLCVLKFQHVQLHTAASLKLCESAAM